MKTKISILFIGALLLSTVIGLAAPSQTAWAAGPVTVVIKQSLAGPVQLDPTNTSPINFKAIFSESVTGFGDVAGDIDFTGSTNPGALSATVSGSGSVYVVQVTGMVNGDTVIASIPAGAATGVSGSNQASTSPDNSVTYDTVAPTVTINQKSGQADPTNGTPILYTVVFSEPVTGFDGNDITFTGTAPGVKVATASPTGPSTYQISVTGMTGSGTVIAAVRANAGQDSAGNWSRESTQTDNTVTYDVTAPTVTINQSAAGPVQNDPANTSPIVFKAVFTEAVSGFGDVSGDISFTGSTNPGALTATVAGSGSVYTVQVSGMVSGDTVVVSVPASAATDLAGNNSAASTSTDNSVTYLTAAPTVTINQAGSQLDPATTSPIAFTVVFSAAVTGFTSADVNVTGSAAGTKVINITGGPSTYTVNVSGMTSRGSVQASVVPNAAQDISGNWSVASTSTDNIVDYRMPLVVDTTVDENNGCIQGSCSLREAITAGLTGDTITFNLTYPATITLGTNIDIDHNVTVAGPGADKVTIQGAGSNNIFLGHVGHTITISDLTIAGGSDATQGAGINNLGTLTLDKVVLSDNSAPSGGAVYNQGTLTITNSTLADNHATSGAAIYNAGTLSMTNSTLGINQATGQAGGIYNANGATMTLLHVSIIDNPGGGVYNAGTMNYTSTVIAKNGSGECTLSGTGSLGTNVTNFVGNSACSASFSGNPLLDGLGSKSTEPTDTFAPLSGSPLLNTANLGTCPAKDQRGVSRPIGAGCDIGSFEGNRPSVTVNQATGQADPTASGPILFTLVFSDPVTGFADDDVLLTGSTAPGSLTASVSQVAPNDGTTYQISVANMTGTGTVIATIKSEAAQNAQGNANGAPTFTDHTVTYDVTAPSVTVNQSIAGPVQPDPATTSPINFKVVFSEPVTGFGNLPGDISFTGSTNPGALTATVVGSGSVYVVQVSGMVPGDTVMISIPANAALDLAGNNNTASTSTDNTVTYNP